MHPTNKAARAAGAVYLALVLTAPFSLLYVPGKLIVRGDTVATAHNILAHELLFRLCIVSELLSSVIFICLGMALYRFLSEVGKGWARLMVGFVLVSAAVGFLNVLNYVAALTLFHGVAFLGALEKSQCDALGMLFVRLHGQGEMMNEIFWGVWLFPFGLLVYRSGFLPRFLGVWLILACFGWIALSLTALLFPPYYETAFKVAQPVLFAEMAMMLWLLIKGAKPHTSPSVEKDVAFPGTLPASPSIDYVR